MKKVYFPELINEEAAEAEAEEEEEEDEEEDCDEKWELILPPV